MPFNFGDIVLVPFPFTDQTGSKKRPAVIVSSKTYNQKQPDIIIMAATSQRNKSVYFGDVPIDEWQKAGLLKPSVVKPVFATIENDLVIKKLGALTINDKKNLSASLLEILKE